ncbi:MAG: bifunctional UDP-N-acetylglucosamine diphosphorylase/glucosamine-1-phosphate N-acetyltransferase GlmU [Actinomycetota bacterium]|nr:bifunctional UDP-N-acetylglucosamine diphosphorylase/glucosamine-1-phosphate N-acetyltransferase GlmU [Actinomycetota bacterium]
MAVKAIVLAAGAGTRMKSDMPKVLHEVCGKPLIHWVLRAVGSVEPQQVMVVLGHGEEAVRAALPEGVDTCLQDQQLGTGHATQTALEAMEEVAGHTILVVPGDAPLLDGETLAHLLATHRNIGAAVSVLTAQIADPSGYGRVLRDGWDRMCGIVEHKDATLTQLQIGEVNAGVYAFAGELLAKALARLEKNNAQGEYYLTDVVAILGEDGHQLNALKTEAEEVVGVNSPDQLAEAGRLIRRRINARWMRAGVWMLDPERVYLDADVRLERGVRLYPDVYLEGATAVGEGAELGPDVYARDSRIGQQSRVWYSVLREAEVGAQAEVGPFASLRPGTRLGDRSKAGTFVEMKNSQVGEGSKVPHLSYLGDAQVGREANIGAGTITANYDGFQKHQTVVGDRAFIGSDTMLVAPVRVGDEAVTGAGSVITEDVSPGALGIERSSQREVPGYASRRRERRKASPEEE